VWCWGRNDFGQLGAGTIGQGSNVPVRVAGGLRVISLAVTSGAACAIDVQGVAWCWGATEQGVVNGSSPSAVPVAVPTPRRFFQIASDGSGSVCAIDAEQLVYCWGSNLNGGRGRDGVGVSSTPVAIEGTDFFVGITGGDDGFLALTVDRTIVVWGGLTGTPFAASPVRVLPQYVFGEIITGGGRGAVCVRAYPNGTRCIDRVGAARALTTAPEGHLIYGVPGT
jgi:alpha-tubulin suppressor-like RCC1 family protein